MVQPIQNTNLGAPFLRPVEARRFPEAAGRTAAIVTRVVLAAIASIVSFVLLPWQAALGVSAAAAFLLLCCCRGERPQQLQEPLPRPGPAPAPVIILDRGDAPARRWFHRFGGGGFFQRRVPDVDRRPREPVGLGQLNPDPADAARRPMAPRHGRVPVMPQAGPREIAGARYRGDGGFFGRAARGGAVAPPGGAPIGPAMRPPAPARGGEREPVGLRA